MGNYFNNHINSIAIPSCEGCSKLKLEIQVLMKELKLKTETLKIISLYREKDVFGHKIITSEADRAIKVLNIFGEG